MKFYNTNGIPTDSAVQDRFYIVEFMNGKLAFGTGDQTFELEKICILLTETFARKIFGDIKNYYNCFTDPFFPLASNAGIDADTRISKEDFETLVNVIEDKERRFQLLYYFDIENLVSTLQNSVMETKNIVSEFYKALNNDSILIDNNIPVVDGIQFTSGHIVTHITSLVNHLFISMYSQMDLTTKIIYEFENLHTSFNAYPKLKAKDILYGDSKRTAFREMAGSIYERSGVIQMIICLRNEIVHNASIDRTPKVYQNIKSKKIIEKFILLPDFSNGIIKTFKNRKRFFHDDTKLNEILPGLINEFWSRLKFTLSEIK